MLASCDEIGQLENNNIIFCLIYNINKIIKEQINKIGARLKK